ncbi:hypothetical protein Tco_1154685 [Tanacetum coccineum]
MASDLRPTEDVLLWPGNANMAFDLRPKEDVLPWPDNVNMTFDLRPTYFRGRRVPCFGRDRGGGKKDSNTVTRSVDSSSTRNDEHDNTKRKGMSSDDPTGSIAKKISEEGVDIGKQTSGDSSQTVNVPNNSSWPVSFAIFSKDRMNAMIENDAWSSYVRAMVELRADVELKDTLVVVVSKFMDEGYTKSTIRVEYELTPPRCSNSDNEVDEVFNKTTGSMTSTSSEVNKSGSGVGNKGLYEQCKKTYNEDPYDDDDFDDCGLTNAHMKFATTSVP